MNTQTQTQKPFILVDGSSYLFRAYHALPALMNSKGQHAGAIYGVINMLRKLVKDYDPELIAVVFDSKGKTFRHKLYPEYKANRPSMPEELASQIKPLHDIIKAMGLPLIRIDGIEADDIIGTYAEQATQHKLPTIISTGDKDMAQLVNEHVTCINTMSNAVLDEAGVEKKFGVRPDQIIDYLSLMGDTVDNIPGVPKVGPITAAKWLSEYDTLENLVKHADDIKGKVGENLRGAIPDLAMSKALVTIDRQLPLPDKITTLKPTDKNAKKLTEWFTELEFKTWLSESLGDTECATKNTYDVVLTQADFDRWLEKLRGAETIAFDTETTSLHAMQAELVGVSFAIENGEAAYVPVAHDYIGAPEQLDRAKVLEQLVPILTDTQKTIVGQNLKYDINVLLNYDVSMTAKLMDTMLESYVFNSTGTRHNMDDLALKYLGKNTIHFEDVAGKGVKQLTFNQVALEQAGPYAAEDADITLQLHQMLSPKLTADEKLKAVFDDIEMPVMPILAKMERAGVLIDATYLNALSTEFAERIGVLQKEAFQLAGAEFNLASPKQLRAILFDQLKLPILKKTPKGQPSTGEEVLQALALDYPLPKIILAYRSLSKLKSTYTDSLPKQVNPKTGRVHTSYNQAVAATGRLSSTDPNLQNIPVRTADGRRIRQAFIAPPGHKLVSADYSQIELRIMAHMADDASLKHAFANGLDIHRATAAEVVGVEIDQVTDEQRRSAKAVNFGLIYGMSAFGLAKQLGIKREAAQEYIDTYFHRYPGVKAYMETTREKAAEQGYIETLYGRRLYLPDITSSQFMRRSAAERAAINAPMQGTAADIIKLAMIKVNEWLTHNDVKANMIMQVHDELVFEVPAGQVDAAIVHIKEAMEHAVELSVPIEVHVGIGDNWDEAH